jgi:multiple sugar transport system substrate-binding protein
MMPVPRPNRLTLAAATVSIALLATACGGSGSSDEAGSGGKPVTLDYWGWTLGAQEVADAFNKSHKDVQVRFSQIPGGPDGYSKITNAIKAGNGPDVVGIEYPQLPEFATQGLLEDLSDAAGTTVGNTYPQAVQDLVTLGGKVWAVPYDVTPNLLYYRKDIFRKAGVQVPTTWDQFRNAAEKIKKSDPGVRIAGWGSDDPALLPALAWQAGAEWYGVKGDAWKVGIDDAASRKVAAYWQGLADDGLVRKTNFIGPEFPKSLTNGTVASYIGASWSAGGHLTTYPKQAGKWGIAPLPTWDGKPSSGMYGGTTYAVPKGTEAVKAAAEFATWAGTSPQAVKARLSNLKSPSSALPAAPALRDVAAKSFDDKGYFGGDDVYEIAGKAAGTVVPGWTWGPVQAQANNAVTDAWAKGTVGDGLAAGQRDAAKAIKNRGLNLAR